MMYICYSCKKDMSALSTKSCVEHDIIFGHFALSAIVYNGEKKYIAWWP